MIPEINRLKRQRVETRFPLLNIEKWVQGVKPLDKLEITFIAPLAKGMNNNSVLMSYCSKRDKSKSTSTVIGQCYRH